MKVVRITERGKMENLLFLGFKQRLTFDAHGQEEKIEVFGLVSSDGHCELVKPENLLFSMDEDLIGINC